MKEQNNSIELKNHILEFKNEQLKRKDRTYILKKFICNNGLVLIITIISLYFLLINKDTNKGKDNHKNFIEISNEKNEVLGEINCVYEVSSLNRKVPLFGKEFIKSSNFSVYLDSKLIQFSKEYEFKTLGKHDLKILLYEDLNMDYMFKEVPNLVSINMTSNKNCKILSMISTFQNDHSFIYFTINGFNAEKIKSMKYCFYNSSLVRFSFHSFDSKNLEDISYMFSRTKFYSFSLNGLNTINIKNMSHLFENNLNLGEFSQEDFNTSKVKDLSFMFSNCYSLSRINISKFDTNNVESTAGLFYYCLNLESIDISNFNLSNNKDMSNMFSSCYHLDYLNLGKIITTNVENMSGLFYGCSN